jgi:hypothetical protein
MDEKIYIKTGDIINCIHKTKDEPECEIYAYEFAPLGDITLSDEKIIPILIAAKFIRYLDIESDDFNLTKNILKNIYKNNNVQKLSVDLFDPQITKYLMDILKINTSVEMLYLYLHEIDEIDDIISMLKINTTIKLLDLTKNYMNYDESVKLMKMLVYNKNIKILQIDDVFHKESIPNLVEMLKINKSIKEIYLEYININEDEYKILLNALKENTNIIKFNFRSKYVRYDDDLKDILYKNQQRESNFVIYYDLFKNKIPRYIMKMISN